jgi:hypothetical protein
LSQASTTTAIEQSGADLDGDGSVSSLDRLDSWLVLIRLVAFVPDVRSALADAHVVCPEPRNLDGRGRVARNRHVECDPVTRTALSRRFGQFPA